MTRATFIKVFTAGLAGMFTGGLLFKKKEMLEDSWVTERGWVDSPNKDFMDQERYLFLGTRFVGNPGRIKKKYRKDYLLNEIGNNLKNKI